MTDKKKPPRVIVSSYDGQIGRIQVLIGNKLYVRTGISEDVFFKLMYLLNNGWYGRALQLIRKWKFKRADKKTYKLNV